MDYQDLVKRLRANLDKYPGFVNLNADAATAIETLLAQRAVLVKDVEAWRRRGCPKKKLYSWGKEPSDVIGEARAATDAAFKGGLPK